MINNSFGQYQMIMKNDLQTGPSIYEFDVFVKSTATDFNLTSYQLVFTYNTAIANGGILTFSYLAGSSGLTNPPSIGVGINNDGGIQNLTAGSNPGSDIISTTEIKVGRFRITNTLVFAVLPSNVDWDFGGAIVTEVNIGSTNETNPSNHVNNLVNAPLPVELSSFSATINQNVVNLKWQTKTEVNNYGFEIERKAANNEKGTDNWEKIGFVNGNGNSNSPKEYTLTDKNPTGGSKFAYRLKQIDNDGKYEYSNEVEVELVPREYILYQNYPNPFNPTTKIKFALPKATKVSLLIYNLLGEKVATLLNEDKEAGFYNVQFNASNFSTGVYIFRLTAGDFVQTKKMTLVK